MCRLIKDFEREARVDNMPPLDLATRKKALVQELNGFITAKKEFTQDQAVKAELISAGGSGTAGAARAGGPSLRPCPRTVSAARMLTAAVPARVSTAAGHLPAAFYRSQCAVSDLGRQQICPPWS